MTSSSRNFPLQPVLTGGPARPGPQSKACPSSGVLVVDAGLWHDGLVFWPDASWQQRCLQAQVGRLGAAGLAVSLKYTGLRGGETAHGAALTHMSSQAGWADVQSASLHVVLLFHHEKGRQLRQLRVRVIFLFISKLQKATISKWNYGRVFVFKNIFSSVHQWIPEWICLFSSSSSFCFFFRSGHYFVRHWMPLVKIMEEKDVKFRGKRA